MSSAPADPTVAAADAVLSRAARSARRYLLSPLMFLRSVGGIERVVQAYHRARFIIERRSAVVCYGPAPAGSVPSAPPDPTRIDLWQAEPAQVADASRVTVTCVECKGIGQSPCPELARKRHMLCSDCAGTGQVAGARGDKKCSRCRGSGLLGCRTCFGGFIPCRLCEGSGRRSAWIEIRSEKHLQVKAERGHPLAQANSRLLQANDFDGGPWPHTLLSDEIIQGSPARWPLVLHPTLDPRTERVLWTRLQVFGEGKLRIRYTTAIGQGVLSFDEQGNGPLAESALRPLIWRTRLVWGAVGVCALGALVLTLRFITQHVWFARFGHGGWGLLLGLLAAPLVGAAVAEGLLPKGLRRPRRIIAPSLLAGTLGLAVSLLFALERPSSARAEAALRQGDLERASTEAEALRESHGETEASAHILDAVHGQRFAAADTLEKRLELAAAAWSSAELRTQAWASVQRDCERLIAEAVFARDAKRLADIQQLTQPYLPEIAQRAAQQAAIARAEACLQSQDIDCALREERAARGQGAILDALAPARDRARAVLQGQLAADVKAARSSRSPTERHTALTHALKVAEQLKALTGEEPEPSREQLAMQLKQAASRLEREEARQQRRRAARPLLCCDNTRSPTCRCGGSTRGCCSHHGGVCGGCD